MTLYYSPSKNSFFDSEIHNIKSLGSDLVEISKEKHAELLKAPIFNKTLTSDANGNPILIDSVISEASKERSERSWRNSELLRADYELNKVQDSDPKASGSVSMWREYRKELRAWPAAPDFPEKTKRPKAPDSKE